MEHRKWYLTWWLENRKGCGVIQKRVKQDPNNYRPISLSSHFDKIFEKILCRRMISFLERNELLFCYQYGFRKLYSTGLALIELTCLTRKCVISLVIYSRRRLIQLTMKFYCKLEYYGCWWIVNNFFRSYLTNRRQYTVIMVLNLMFRLCRGGYHKDQF